MPLKVFCRFSHVLFSFIVFCIWCSWWDFFPLGGGGGWLFFAFGQTLSQHLSVFFGCGEIMILEINFLADMLKSHCLLFKHYFPLGYWGLNPTSPPPPIYLLKKSTVKWILKIMTTLEECSMQNIVLSTPLAFLVEIKILEINF